MKTRRSRLLTIFITFFKIGMFTFGGGFAMIPLLEKEVVEKQEWIEKERFIDAISLTQSVPGAVAINLSIFLGYNIAGTIGAIIAAFAVSLPSFLIILLIAFYFNTFSALPIVKNIFRGIRPAVVGLIIYAGYNLSKNISWSYSLFTIFLFVLMAGIILNINPVILIVSVISVSTVIYHLNKNSNPERAKRRTLKELLQKN